MYIHPFHMYVYTLTNMHQFRKIYNIIIHILHIMLSTYMNTYTHVHVQTFKWGANFTSIFSDNVKSNAHFFNKFKPCNQIDVLSRTIGHGTHYSCVNFVQYNWHSSPMICMRFSSCRFHSVKTQAIMHRQKKT